LKVWKKEEEKRGAAGRGGQISFVKMTIDGQEHRSLIKEKLRKSRSFRGFETMATP
jgi:hypothetical protein